MGCDIGRDIGRGIGCSKGRDIGRCDVDRKQVRQRPCMSVLDENRACFSWEAEFSSKLSVGTAPFVAMDRALAAAAVAGAFAAWLAAPRAMTHLAAIPAKASLHPLSSSRDEVRARPLRGAACRERSSQPLRGFAMRGAMCRLSGARIDGMETRRCLHCERKIHPSLRPDAKFCGRSCKSSYQRDRKATPPADREPRIVHLSPGMRRLAETVCAFAPSDAVGFQLRRNGSKEGAGLFIFPVQGRKTKRADGSLQVAALYHLRPFEPPRIPWVGEYELWFWSNLRGLVQSEFPDGGTVYIATDQVTPRAAFDRHAVVLESCSAEGGDLGSRAYLQREIVARAPAQAVGYHLYSLGTMPGTMGCLFPPRHQVSRRWGGGCSDAPYFSLHPFEPPLVPWLGEYRLSYELADSSLYFLEDPAAQTLVVGVCFPHAVPKPPKIVPTPSLHLALHGTELHIAPTTKPARKLLNAAKREPGSVR